MMKIEKSACCPLCNDSMGEPEKVVEEDNCEYTEYICCECDGIWYRPHNDY